jgi:hypothetical protein
MMSPFRNPSAHGRDLERRVAVFPQVWSGISAPFRPDKAGAAHPSPLRGAFRGPGMSSGVHSKTRVRSRAVYSFESVMAGVLKQVSSDRYGGSHSPPA